MDDARTSEQSADSAKAATNDGPHTMKEAVNTAMESTQGLVQELQSDAVEAVNQTIGRTIDRVKESLDQQRPRVEHYISEHPWIVLEAWCYSGTCCQGNGSREPDSSGRCSG